jgi:hypothetical protein
MRIAYYPNQCALNSVPVMQAMLDTLRSAGHVLVENGQDCDSAIIWSALWAGRMAPNKQVYEYYRAHNRPVIIADVGTLDRGKTWKIAVNHINNLGYYGHAENLDPDRPQKLGVSLAVNSSRNPTILIAAQHRYSLQLADQDHETWILEQIDKIRQISDRPIIVRPHPRSPLSLLNLDKSVKIERPQLVSDTYDSFDIIFDHHAVVNYCSGPGIQAAILGTRPVVSACSLASPVAVAIDDIDRPYDTDRDQWLVEICHTEYTLEEITQGLWLKRLSAAL